jgi:hypothetical protein
MPTTIFAGDLMNTELKLQLAPITTRLWMLKGLQSPQAVARRVAAPAAPGNRAPAARAA